MRKEGECHEQKGAEMMHHKKSGNGEAPTDLAKRKVNRVTDAPSVMATEPRSRGADRPGLRATPEAGAPACGERGAGGKRGSGGPVLLALVHDRVGLGDGPLRMRALDQRKLRWGCDRAGLQNAEVPAGAARLLDAGGELLDAPAAGKLPAGLARLGDLHEEAAHAEDVSDADRGFERALGREIFPEGAEGKLHA